MVIEKTKKICGCRNHFSCGLRNHNFFCSFLFVEKKGAYRGVRKGVRKGALRPSLTDVRFRRKLGSWRVAELTYLLEKLICFRYVWLLV